MEETKIKEAVREGYGRIAREGLSCCLPSSSCCGVGERIQEISSMIGYSEAELRSVPAEANLGLGCGNPLAEAEVKEGDTVLDLGSGAGFDCFLAANMVGPRGRVIGVDMTPEMVEKARGNAIRSGYGNVEFRLGEIEHLPVADNAVDWVISNCVINLSPQKDKVFQEAYRVLKPGGTLLVSDLVLLKPLPASLRDSLDVYIGCVAGAVEKEEYLNAIAAAGFVDVQIMDERIYPLEEILVEGAGEFASLRHTLASIRLRARKP
ncbi:MAG: arsenite methyltransferase [Syntrophales bacterium]|nr:arsenite methyltransferase [Syntrophales bacterium]